MVKTRYIIPFAILLIIGSGSAIAEIPKDLKAKSEYSLAKKKNDEGDFESAVEHLKNAKILLGETNSKIQYMLVKALWNLGDYINAESELEIFFDVAPENESSTDQYNEMVVLVSEIGEKKDETKRKQAEEEAKLQAEAEARYKAEEMKIAELDKAGLLDKSRLKNIQHSLQKMCGDDCIPLNQALQNGIKSPFLKISVGMKWTEKTVTLYKANGDELITTIQYEVISKDEDLCKYSLRSNYINLMGNGKEIPTVMLAANDDETVVTKWYDGLLHKFEFPTSIKITEWNSAGYEWPNGMLRAGDCWESEYSYTTDYIRSENHTIYTVLGFENYIGYDCIIFKKVSDDHSNYSNNHQDTSQTTIKSFIDYNTGALVYAEVSSDLYDATVVLVDFYSP